MIKRIAFCVNLACMCIAVSILLTGCGNNSPVKSQTVWEGEAFILGNIPFPMIMQINERNGAEISGILHYPSIEDSKTMFRGKIKVKKLSFTEYELIQGSWVFAFPASFEGWLKGEAMSGTWRGGGRSGNFQVDKIKEK